MDAKWAKNANTKTSAAPQESGSFKKLEYRTPNSKLSKMVDNTGNLVRLGYADIVDTDGNKNPDRTVIMDIANGVFIIMDTRTQTEVARYVIVQSSSGGVYTAVKISLTSVQILALNGSPVTIIVAGGAGTATEVNSVFARLNFNSVAYTLAGSDMNIYETDSSGTSYGSFITGLDFFLTRSADVIVKANLTASGNFLVLGNKNIVIATDTGNPTNGDSTIDIYAVYRIITL